LRRSAGASGIARTTRAEIVPGTARNPGTLTPPPNRLCFPNRWTSTQPTSRLCCCRSAHLSCVAPCGACQQSLCILSSLLSAVCCPQAGPPCCDRQAVEP
jgi:hypothetical protein